MAEKTMNRVRRFFERFSIFKWEFWVIFAGLLLFIIFRPVVKGLIATNSPQNIISYVIFILMLSSITAYFMNSKFISGRDEHFSYAFLIATLMFVFSGITFFASYGIKNFPSNPGEAALDVFQIDGR